MTTAIDVDAYPILDDTQAGHIRHLRNLMALPDGDWSKMGTMEPGQEGLSSLRYQIAHIFYALALAHFHRLPAAPSLFAGPMATAMRKMLRYEVWGYWRETSRSGPRVDPGLTELREPWGDPVARENIMYSGHLHAMAGMYGVLFDDDRFERPGSLVLERTPLFVGDEERYEYDFGKLTETIYWQMVENGWLGVACEPNCIFLFCNQLPMLGFRFHDIRTGSSIADEAAASYRNAWQQREVLDDANGTIPTFLFQRQDVLIPGGPANTAHTSAIMNAWNRDFVHEHYRSQVYRALKTVGDGTISVLPSEGLPQSADSYAEDGSEVVVDEQSFVWRTHDFGAMAMVLSEMGDSEKLAGLLAHADRHMNPTWERGGLFYPRHDESYDADGNLTFVEPMTGNSLLAYARLNVPDGLWSLANQPWSSAHFRQPRVEEVDERLDVLRAVHDDERGALVVTLRPAPEQGRVRDALVRLANPGGGRARVGRDGHDLVTAPGPTVSLRLDVEERTDLVAVWEGDLR